MNRSRSCSLGPKRYFWNWSEHCMMDIRNPGMEYLTSSSGWDTLYQSPFLDFFGGAKLVIELMQSKNNVSIDAQWLCVYQHVQPGFTEPWVRVDGTIYLKSSCSCSSGSSFLSKSLWKLPNSMSALLSFTPSSEEEHKRSLVLPEHSQWHIKLMTINRPTTEIIDYR